MGWMNSNSELEDEKEDEDVNVCELIQANERTVFSCESFNSCGSRELVLTPTSIIVRYNDKGGSFPVQSSTIEFSSKADSYRITVCDGDVAYGLQVSKEDFKQFWKCLSEIRSM